MNLETSFAWNWIPWELKQELYKRHPPLCLGRAHFHFPLEADWGCVPRFANSFTWKKSLIFYTSLGLFVHMGMDAGGTLESEVQSLWVFSIFFPFGVFLLNSFLACFLTPSISMVHVVEQGNLLWFLSTSGIELAACLTQVQIWGRNDLAYLETGDPPHLNPISEDLCRSWSTSHVTTLIGRGENRFQNGGSHCKPGRHTESCHLQ